MSLSKHIYASCQSVSLHSLPSCKVSGSFRWWQYPMTTCVTIRIFPSAHHPAHFRM